MLESILLSFAKMADDVYAPPNSTRMLGLWATQEIPDAVDANFRARVYKAAKGSIAAIAIRGSANWQDWIIADAGAIGLSLNALALKLNFAIDFTMKIKSKSKLVWLVGHSLGGAYVQLLSGICAVPGVTFNAPGVLGLVNQLSNNWGVKLAGAVGGGAMSVYTGGITDLLNEVAGNFDPAAFPPVSNYRGNMDPVSLIGVHVGAPLQTIKLLSQAPNPHSMVPIIRTLELSGGR